MKREKKTIVSLVDLAGYGVFLKTTITGIMTREYYSSIYRIPILFILTKVDIIPKKPVKENINKMKILSKKYGKTIQ